MNLAKPDIHDDCHVFDVDSLPVDHIENVYRAEVCLCNEGRYCIAVHHVVFISEGCSFTVRTCKQAFRFVEGIW